MSDQLAFLEWLDVGEAGGQTDVKKINRQSGESQEDECERQRDPDDALFQLRDGHGVSSARS
jgi:hypothetical protein